MSRVLKHSKYPVIGFMVLLLVMLLTGCEEQLPTAKIGTPAPAFSLNRLDGTTIQFPEHYRDKIVAIRFWADWCPFCKSFLTIFESAVVKRAEPLGALANISDESNPLWETFKVDIVPTLVGFREGLVIVRKDGVAGMGLGMRELKDALRKMEKR